MLLLQVAVCVAIPFVQPLKLGGIFPDVKSQFVKGKLLVKDLDGLAKEEKSKQQIWVQENRGKSDKQRKDAFETISIENLKDIDLNLTETNRQALKDETIAVVRLTRAAKQVEDTFKGEAAEACQRNINGIGWSLYDLWHNSMSYYKDNKATENMWNLIGACSEMINSVSIALSNCQASLGECNQNGVKFLTLVSVTATDFLARVGTGIAGLKEEDTFCSVNSVDNVEYALNTQNAHAISGLYELVPSIFDMRDMVATIRIFVRDRFRSNSEDTASGIMAKFQAYSKMEETELVTVDGGKQPISAIIQGDPQAEVGVARRKWQAAVEARNSQWFKGHLLTELGNAKEYPPQKMREGAPFEDDSLSESWRAYRRALWTDDRFRQHPLPVNKAKDQSLQKAARVSLIRVFEIFLSIIADICGSLDKWFAENAYAYRAGGPKNNTDLNRKMGCWASYAKLAGAGIGAVSDLSEVVSCGVYHEGFAWKAIGDKTEKLENLLTEYAFSKKEELCAWADVQVHATQASKAARMTAEDKMMSNIRELVNNWSEKEKNKKEELGLLYTEQIMTAEQNEVLKELQTAVTEFTNEKEKQMLTQSYRKKRQELGEYLKIPCSQGGFLDDTENAGDLMERVLVVYEKLMKKNRERDLKDSI